MIFSPFHFSRRSEVSIKGIWKTLPPESLGKAFGFWWMRLLLHAVNILLLTIILSYFIAFYHASKLPLLFLTLSIGILVGTLLFQFLLKKYPLAQLLKIIALGGGIILALGFLYFSSNIAWFLGTTIGVYTVIGIQMNILFFLLVEKSFSPLESEEAFPLIESAEPLGGVLGGMVAFLGSSLVPPESLLLFGTFLLFCFFGILTTHSHHHQSHRDIIFVQQKKQKWSITSFEKYPMILGLSIFVFLQGSIFIIVELLYSMALGALFSHQSIHSTESIIATELAHGIGLVHIVIYGILFLTQLLLASKIQHHLGVIKTLFLQPTLLIANTLIAIFSGTFWTGIAGKGVYEVLGGLSKNSYHTSFYAFPENIRESIKEFLEGFIRPLGMLMASLLLIIFSSLSYLWKWNFEGFFFVSSTLLFAFLLLQVILKNRLKKGYTDSSIQNIHHSKNLEEQLDAIEILSQNGHENSLKVLSTSLRSEQHPLVIQKKIIQSFGKLQDANALPEIIWCLNHSDTSLQQTAVESLGQYSSLKQHFVDQSFSRYKVIESLQEVFLHAESKKLRLAIIEVFKKIQYPEIAKFLIHSLKSDNPETVFCSILGCSSFRDISIAYYILPLLENPNSYIKSSSIIALWQFARYKEVVISHLHEMINSDDPNMKLSAVYTTGEIRYAPFKNKVEAFLKNSSDHHVIKHCLIALVKMGYKKHASSLVSLLFHDQEEISGSTKKLLFSPGVESSLQHHIRSFIRNRIIKSIKQFLTEEKKHTLEELSPSSLRKLLNMYQLIENEKMIWKIKIILGEE